MVPHIKPPPLPTHGVRGGSLRWGGLYKQWLQRRPSLSLLANGLISIATVLVILHAVVFGFSLAMHRSSEPLRPVPPPPPPFASPDIRECYYKRDVGLLTEIPRETQVFCARGPGETKPQPTRRTEVSLIDLTEKGLNMRAVVFNGGLELDFTKVKIHQPIASMAGDGGSHDPRFKWHPSIVSCGCDELQAFAKETFDASNATKPLRLWDLHLIGEPEKQDHASTVCGTSPQSVEASSDVIEINEKTILIARRDDHNPFFQVSNALNSWLLMRSMGWKREETRVIHMDGGYESPIDALHHRLLSSPEKYEILRGRQDLMGKRLQFSNHVLLAPREVTGVMMEHLNDKEPCGASHLMKEFRAEARAIMGVGEASPIPRQITVTIISRRDYNGRRIQRRWLNENEVLGAMQTAYRSHDGIPIVVQSVDFVNMTLQEQMTVAGASDVIIGMHGAGMVNVLWTRPKTLVVEIFPKFRKRWGYRNLCQFVGCDWHEFRGGNDTGKGDNASDKLIPADEWLNFFGPLFGDHLFKLASLRTGSSDSTSVA